jgi:hypothetical protein
MYSQIWFDVRFGPKATGRKPGVQARLFYGWHPKILMCPGVQGQGGARIRYGGGVGGLTIPANKAITQWNRLKHADFDCFGHFHQAFDGGTFISNGSMIGYNAYAISIKAAYEEPVQMLFGIHSKLGKYITRSIKFLP